MSKQTFVMAFGLILSASLACSAIAAGEPSATSRQQTLYLVKDGEPRSVIVAQQPEVMGVQQAVDELQDHIRRASGATLPVVSAEQAAALPPDRVRIVIGPGPLAESLGVDAATLLPEQYRIKTVGNHLVFVGHDISKKGTYERRGRAEAQTLHSAATMWAVDRFLDRQLGVRWLWPGESGTYVPRHDTIALPVLDVTDRPTLVRRQLRYLPYQRGVNLISAAEHAALRADAQQWLMRHGMGSRVAERHFGHGFTHWWAKYHETHPDFFAMSPDGERTPRPRRKGRPGVRVKLCVSNEAIDQQVIAEWKAAGMPPLWGVAPNDGTGFCTCDDCRAMDVPANQDPQLIWGSARAELTGRYVKFWSRLLEKMRAIKPDVTLVSLAYSAYREPPSPGLSLHPGMMLSVVPAPWQRDLWLGWERAGAQLMLRPNWWHTGRGGGGVMPLEQEGRFFKMAHEHGMAGFFFDSILGYWGLQGPRYYLIARLAQRPDLSIDQVIDEYCSAFGEAAPAVRDYIDYWQDFTKQAGYSYNAGGVLSDPDGGRYIEVVRKHDLIESALIGGWQVLPYLYTDQVLDHADALLGRAAEMAGDNPRVNQRIAFLRGGMEHLRLTRDVLRMGYEKTRPEDATAEQFQALCDKLRTLRHDLTLQGVIWGETIVGLEKRYGIPSAPDRTSAWTEQDLRGL